MVLRNGLRGMEGTCTLSPISPQGFFPSLHTHRSPWADRALQPTAPYQSLGCSRWVTQAPWISWIPSLRPESGADTPQPHTAAPSLWDCRAARATPKRGRQGEASPCPEGEGDVAHSSGVGTPCGEGGGGMSALTQPAEMG